MTTLNRRDALALGAGTFLAALLAGRGISAAATSDTLTIAFNVNLPSFDPTVGPNAVNPAIQAIYRTVFDHFVDQGPDLAFKPGLLTEWGWNEDKTKVWMTVREGVTWHDGTPLTAEDIVWSLERAAKQETGNPIQFIWSTAGNYKIDGNKITGDVLRYEPTYFMWMAYLTGYVLPKAHYEKVGAEGFEKKPIGTGPYMVDAYEGNSFLRLKANPNYFGGKPPFETVVFKFVPDATSRVAEIESGSSDVTLDIPYEEFDRLKSVQGLAGIATPITDIGMIFITNVDVMLDKNVRLAAHHAIDKKAIVDRLLRGYGVPIDTLEAPNYAAFDPSITVGYDPQKAKELLAASGYSTDKPAKFTIQTTRGLKPKDYEMIQAIVGMWRKVGIEANIEVYEIAKHFELRAAHQLAPAAFYNWGNAIIDPTTSTGFAMFGPSPHSAWKTEDLDKIIGPLWGEKDEEKRIAGWKAVSKYIAENGYVIPLLQYVQPVVFKSDLKVTPDQSGALQPVHVEKA
ncbi:peptide/nickel transport system substrate-binding protein [Mesorhizobium soli]|jgi:peptide/nickel transport system substrate-binding protein|uniref:ABC transporter substrate-binding protein n=1 Tax=Pseudaminobacter soli (ex Li et al. 2025) TaxID=1295366 RepID=UPI002476B685|nr:ABC transporter substrate-binding protein [Mesorhizobium soli]MDH6231902.1 peptide/nickel transport system substrate-binding protein [Mesorhizobium soli]